MMTTSKVSHLKYDLMIGFPTSSLFVIRIAGRAKRQKRTFARRKYKTLLSGQEVCCSENRDRIDRVCGPRAELQVVVPSGFHPPLVHIIRSQTAAGKCRLLGGAVDSFAMCRQRQLIVAGGILVANCVMPACADGYDVKAIRSLRLGG